MNFSNYQNLRDLFTAIKVKFTNRPETIEISQADYNALTPAQKTDKTKVYYIYDAESGGDTLAGLSDVSVETPTTDDALVYNGSEWVNSPLLNKVNKSGDTMTGTLKVDTKNGTTSEVGISSIEIGNNTPEGSENNSKGVLKIFSNNSHYTTIQHNNSVPLSNTKSLFLPNHSGTIAVADEDNEFTDSQTINRNDGTTTQNGSSRLILGNNIPSGTEGNSAGRLTIYSKGAGAVHIEAEESTYNKTVKLPAVDGTLVATSARNTFTKNQTIDHADGTTTDVGESVLILGNNIASGTEGNSQGTLTLYGEGDEYTCLRASNSTDARDIELPDKSGTVALTDDIPANISDLSDVDLNNLSNGQVIKYNSTTQKWENANESGGGGGASSLAALNDVAISSPTNNQLLKYNSTSSKWENSTQMMTILSYGNSTWSDFIAAYEANAVVYCRASSNSNPSSGSQTRMAFMAYVNNATTPTEVEFQYYRSVNSHSDKQQGDQVFVYKLAKTDGWTVTTRNAFTKIAAGTNMSSSYSNGVLTLNSTGGGGGTTVVANPSGTASADLNKLQVGSSIYNIAGAVANPSGTATAELSKVQIGSTIYAIPTANLGDVDNFVLVNDLPSDAASHPNTMYLITEE